MLSRMTRKQIIELLETVREGIVCPNMNERAAMLDECIAALSISQNICKKELVAERFAQYKDTMDTMTAALGQMKESPAEAITALSLQLLDWLLGELKNEKVKKEIVFLPYKASMWDSLESIWRAAAEDSEHCNAYVVPIPYADLTKEHTVKEWHCEIELFPKDVPVLDFRQVDLEKMHPDVIFIHNPYDYANYVTSVDSHYYSSELKKYTDKLVYVPYFVIGNNLPPHFAQAPGVVNADYVIVESEEIKEQYERYYPGGNPPEGKFLALGSPKYDKVLSAKREDYELPERWQKLLNGRKSILYNTGVSAVLQNRDTYLKKVRSVFDTFKQRDDVVLWWRPHPLLEATFDSMVPEQAEEYRQLREEYIQAGWGIYDDSPELERAITWTDAYYGDPSSVVWMYQATGKPIMIGNEGGYRQIVFWNIEIEGEFAYFVEGYRNLICRLNLKTGNIDKKIQIPRKYLEGTASYGAICKCNDNVFLLPLFAKKILKYDCNNGMFSELCVTNNQYAADGNGGFLYSIAYKQYRYWISARNSEIIKYDTQTGVIKRLTQWYNLLQPYINSTVPSDPLWDLLSYGAIDQEIMYLTVPQTNIIVKLNLETDIASLQKIGRDFHQYQGITFDGKYFWLLDRYSKPVVRWDKETNGIVEYSLFGNDMQNREQYLFFSFIKCSDKKIKLFPGTGKRIAILNKFTGKIENQEIITGDTFFVQNLHDNFLVRYEVRQEQSCLYFYDGTNEIKLFLNAENINEGIDFLQGCQDNVYYEKAFSISELLDAVIKDLSINLNNRVKLCGNNIYAFSVVDSMKL